MNYSYMLNGRKPDKNLLQNYGFVPDGKFLTYRADMPNGLYTVIKIFETQLSVDVFDGIFNKKYAAFSSGHSGSAIRSEVRNIVENILNACCPPTE